MLPNVIRNENNLFLPFYVKVNGTFTVQPNDTKAVGSCQEKTASLKLTFEQGFIMFNYEKVTMAYH